MDKVSQKMSEVIIEFPVHFNPYRDMSNYFDIYEAYTILNDNKLLEHHFNFSEKLVDNLHLYYSDAQQKMHWENGIIKKSRQGTKIWQRTPKKLPHSGVGDPCKPYLVETELRYIC